MSQYDPNQRPVTPPQWQQPVQPGCPPPPQYPVQPYRPHPYPQQPPYWPQQQVVPKSVLGAVAASFVIPGSGAIYAGDKGWGIAILVLWLVSIPLFFVGIGFWTGLICWIAGMISAGAAAQRWNREHGIVS